MTDSEAAPVSSEKLLSSKVVKDGEVVAAGESLKEIAPVLQGIFGPLAQSQEAVAKEGTKRTQIWAGVVKHVALLATVILALLILVAGLALWLGKDQIAEKVLIAVISFLGGLGVGKMLPRS